MAGFFAHSEKSVWKPTKTLTGLALNMISVVIRLKFLLKELTTFCLPLTLFYKKIYVSVRTLSKLTGKPISTKFIMKALESQKQERFTR